MAGKRARVKRTFGEISPLPSGRYRARYRGPDGERHTAPVTFLSRMDAETWLSGQARKVSSGDWTAPSEAVLEGVRFEALARTAGGHRCRGSAHRSCGRPAQPYESPGRGSRRPARYRNAVRGCGLGQPRTRKNGEPRIEQRRPRGGPVQRGTPHDNLGWGGRSSGSWPFIDHRVDDDSKFQRAFSLAAARP